MEGWLQIGNEKLHLPHVGSELKPYAKGLLLSLNASLGPDGFTLLNLRLRGIRSAAELSGTSFKFAADELTKESYFRIHSEPTSLPHRITELEIQFQKCLESSLHISLKMRGIYDLDFWDDIILRTEVQAEFTTSPGELEITHASLPEASARFQHFISAKSKSPYWFCYYKFEGRDRPRRVPGLVRFTVKEGQIQGTGIERHGPFTIEGTVSENGNYTFTKIYPEDPTSQPVIYRGDLTCDGNVQGKWSIVGSNLKGHFLFNPRPDPQVVKLLCEVREIARLSAADIALWPIWETEKGSLHCKPGFVDGSVNPSEWDYLLGGTARLASGETLPATIHVSNYRPVLVLLTDSKPFTVSLNAEQLRDDLPQLITLIPQIKGPIFPIRFKPAVKIVEHFFDSSDLTFGENLRRYFGFLKPRL